MSKIMVVGPPPYWALSKEANATAKNQRVWQLVQPLLADGHEIHLCAEAPQGVERDRLPEGLLVYPFNIASFGWRRTLRRVFDSVRPSAIVAVMWRGAVVSLCLPPDAPLWADIYGYSAGEIQLSLYRSGSDRGLRVTINLSHRVLRRLDAVSVCSHRHADALVGELGMAGRLNRHTVGHAFVHCIPPSVAAAPAPDRDSAPASQLRNPVGKDVELRLLYYGGYNAWTDTATLFQGVSTAMERCPNLVFVSVGGGLDGVDTVSYARLLEQVASSPFRDRFRMLGWISPAQAYAELRRADFGLSVDSWHYETLFGTRTRLVDMMANGVPVITTAGCELSLMIRDRMAGLVCPIGDPLALSDAITHLYTDDGLRRSLAAKGTELLRGEWSPAATTTPLRTWVRSPRPAPDRLPDVRPTVRDRIELAVRARARLMLWHIWGRLG